MVEMETGSRHDGWASLALAALATAASGLAIAEPGQEPAISLAWATGLFAMVWLLAWAQSRWAEDWKQIGPVVLGGFLLAALALPFVVAGVRAAAGSSTGTLEILLLAALRNLGLGLAVAGRRGLSARPGVVVSLFLILVSSCLADGPVVSGLLVAYAIVGGSWLAASHWRGLRLPSMRVAPKRPPLTALALAVGLVLAVSGMAAVGPARVATVLAGLVPSSGGTSWDEPDARSGVGDGENEVKGSEKPESIGFTESDVYLESDRPALYDAFNDMYGEPIKPKRVDRMVSIANKNIQEQKDHAAENLRAGRQFAAVRKRPMAPAHRRPGDREAKALVYVKGPAPLHLGLATFDLFDGRDWAEEAPSSRAFPFSVEKGGDDPWFCRDRPAPKHLGGTVRHQIKVGTLDSSPMPLPAHLDRFRIGRINRPEFFGWAQEGVVRMAGRTVPAGTVIETISHACDPRRLRNVAFAAKDLARPGDYQPAPAVRDLARAWAGDLPRGWSQVEAVVAKIRLHAAHDRGEVVPPECDDVVAHFLFRSRRGPDYLFASTAVALLRELGYSTRLATGLYASPSRYDTRTQHVSVCDDDVHTWAEVRLPDGDWITIEPTPGYQVRPPDLSWSEMLAAGLAMGGNWARGHAVGVVAGFVALALLITVRREVVDFANTLAWHCAIAFNPTHGPARALRLVEGRSRRAGMPRPPGRSPRRWYVPLASESPSAGVDLTALVALVEGHLYAPRAQGNPPTPSPEQVAVCRRAVGDWTLRRFRAIARSATFNEALA